MKICQLCGDKFPILVKIDNKIRNLNGRKYCLKCTPFGSHNTSKDPHNSPTSKIDKITDDEFLNLIKSSNNKTDVFNKLKMRSSGASHKILNRRIKLQNINTNHFKKNGNFENGHTPSNKLPIELILIENSPFYNGSLKARLIKEKIILYECSCGNKGEWNGKKLILQLEHKNGIRNDNRKENLEFLCPNCHSQTDTFSGKNLKNNLRN